MEDTRTEAEVIREGALKACIKCGENKPLTDYSFRKERNKHRTQCKLCRNSHAKMYRISTEGKNQQKLWVGSGKQKQSVDKYLKSEKGISTVKNYYQNNKIKSKALYLVKLAIAKNELIRPNVCDSCKSNSDRIEGHHFDYSKPLEVQWLCRKCHRQWHVINGEGLNAH